MNLIKKHKLTAFVFILLITILFLPALSQTKRPLTFEDVMKFKAIHDPVISVDGEWSAFQALPDRGDGEAVVVGLKNGKRFLMERAAKPQISKDGRWVTAVLEPPAAELEKTVKDKPKPGMALLNTQTGEITEVENIKQFSFSDDSLWLAYWHHELKEDKKKKEETAESKKNNEKSQSRIGGSLWEYPERYIENSPVFFAGRIRTPLLIMFGDEDERIFRPLS